MAIEVLPAPPGPTSVSRRVVVASVASAASSRSRPTKDSSRSGRREAGGRRGGAAARGRRERVEGRVVAEDPGLQVAQLRPGLQPQLLGQDPAGVAEGPQRVGLAVLPVAGQHQEGPPPLDEGLGPAQGLDLGRHLVDPAPGQLRLEAGRQRSVAEGGEAGGRRLADGVVGDLLVRAAPPQGEGLGELARRPLVVAARRGVASADDEALEAVDVQLLGGDGQRVATGGPGHRRHRLAQLGDDRLQGVRRRRAVGPQQVVEAVDRHRLGRVHGQGGEHPPHLEAPDRHGGPIVGEHRNGAQHADLHFG